MIYPCVFLLMGWHNISNCWSYFWSCMAEESDRLQPMSCSHIDTVYLFPITRASMVTWESEWTSRGVWRIQPIININIYMYLEQEYSKTNHHPPWARPSMPGTDSQFKHTCKQSIFSNAGYLTRVLQDHASLASLSSDTPLPKGSSSMLFSIWPQLI